jgi:hypothetical protein
MLPPLLLGAATSLVNIALHSLLTLPVVWFARYMAVRTGRLTGSAWMVATLVPTVAMLMAAHTLEIFVWALVYWMFDVIPANSGFIYFAFVNYTTLGYGDIIPKEGWRILGPITALNGFLLIGLSTAVIFEMLRRIIERAYPAPELDE